jgi:iron complex outermembrane receptor protein
MMNRIQTAMLGTLVFWCMLQLTATVSGEPPATQSGLTSRRADDLTNLSLEDLMNVEVTSVSKKKQSIADAPAAVTVISQDDIARSGFSTIPDLLRLVPGMDVARINSSTWAISARGFNGQYANKLLVLQDGRALYTPLYAGVYWDTVDYILPDLDRIEVIRGPGATLWGANAVNGVINITSKDARDTQGFLVDTRASYQGEDNLGVRYGGELDEDTYYRVYGKARYTNEFRRANGDDAGDDWESLKGGFRIDKHLSVGDSFTLQGDVGADRQRATETTPTFTPPFLQFQRLAPVNATGNMLARWNHRVDDTSDFSVQVYYDYLNSEVGGFHYNQHTFDLDLHDRFMIGTRHEISWGLGYRFINGQVTPSDTVAFQSSKNDNLYSAFIQDTIALQPERWFLMVGSKFEHNDYTGFEIEPSARLMWTPDKHNTLWGAISRAVRTPSRVQNDINAIASRFQQPVGGGVTLPAQVELLGNHNAQSEQLVAYEIGYRMQPVQQVSIDVATFYNNYNTISTLERQAVQPGSPLIVPLQFGNKEHGDTWGGEIAGTYEVTPQWRLSGSYSILETALRNDRNSSDSTSAASDNGSAPQHQFQIHSCLDITRNVQFNSALYYVGHVPDFNIPSYFSADLNVTVQIREGMSLQVGVLNLFDAHHPEYSGIGGSTASEPSRTVYGQLSFKF